jgi:hypothetical protein
MLAHLPTDPTFVRANARLFLEKNSSHRANSA